VPVVLTFDFPPERGGIQIYALRLAQELSALGYRAPVIAPQQRGSAAADAAADVHVIRFPAARGPLRVASAALSFIRHRDAARDGQTIALSWLPGLAAAIVPKPWRGTLTVLVHGTELDVKPGSIRDRLMRFVFARARYVIANSEFVARRVRALGLATAPKVIWPGVDGRSIPRALAPVPTIVFVGRLVARKGVDRLIEALALLPQMDAVLHVVGDGPERATLEALAAARGVRDRVRFSGALDDDARDRALGEAWCFAMPSRAEGGDVEGFGIVYLEAAMAGVAAIGGSGSGAAEAIAHGETGLLVDGSDARAVAAALSDVLGDRERASALGAAGRRRALDGFSWQQSARAVAEHLDLAEAV
jgi:phosphatidylinositol alpha-1,6-mannosyltransferase